MEQSNDQPPLSTVQKCVINALAVGSTLTSVAEAYGVHRVTVYRWIKTHKEFGAALRQARADYVLARRDDLFHLSDRAVETVLALLDNPKSPPAVLLRTAMFILQRPQAPQVGWSMPEPAPNPDGEKLTDSAVIEQDFDRLPGLYNIERDPPAEMSMETLAQMDAERRAERDTPCESTPDPLPADATSCNQMQHDAKIPENVASPASGRSATSKERK